MKTLRGSLRAALFYFLERIALPVLIYPLRLLVLTWRIAPIEEQVLRELIASPRAILITYHGMFLQLLAYCYVLPASGRRQVVLLSPSRDGRLLAAVLKYFKFDSVQGTTNSRGVGGAIEFIRQIDEGSVGLIAVDGPRGPCCRAKQGFLRIANAAHARMFLLVTSDNGGVRFGSWDRAHLPLPFAKVSISLEALPPGDSSTIDVDRIQQGLIASARRLASPVLPSELANPSP